MGLIFVTGLFQERDGQRLQAGTRCRGRAGSEHGSSSAAGRAAGRGVLCRECSLGRIYLEHSIKPTGLLTAPFASLWCQQAACNSIFNTASLSQAVLQHLRYSQPRWWQVWDRPHPTRSISPDLSFLAGTRQHIPLYPETKASASSANEG